MGFALRRNAHQALEEIRWLIGQGYQAVYDADLKGYFDSIPHERLMACVRMRVADRAVLKLIGMWLKVAVVEGGQGSGGGGLLGKRNRQGTPQGGVISPLLSNLYLHWFDKVFHRVGGPAQWANAKLVRYADDFVVLARYQGGKLSGWIESKIEGWMGLEINRDKTRVINLKRQGEKLNFLGYMFRYEKDRRGRQLPLSQRNDIGESFEVGAAEAAGEDRVERYVSSRLPQLINELNGHLKGWANYFSYGYPRKGFRQINRYVRQRLTQHVRRRSQRPFRPAEGVSYYEHFKRMGLVYL